MSSILALEKKSGKTLAVNGGKAVISAVLPEKRYQ